MRFNIPKNTEKRQWTLHSIKKMKYYGLSAQKILGVIRHPKRKEEGVVKNTIAVMQPVAPKKENGKEIWKSEIWAMYQLRGSGAISKSQFPISKQISNSKFKILNSANRKIRVISAWRYPGISPKNNPIPEEIIREIEAEEDSCQAA